MSRRNGGYPSVISAPYTLARIASGDQADHQRDERQDRKGEPQEQQHDDVRNDEQPLDQPQPSRERLVEATSIASGYAPPYPSASGRDIAVSVAT
jgi:hypothetical protein